MQNVILLYVVVGDAAAIQLPARKYEALMMGGSAILVLNLFSDGFNEVGGRNLKRDRPADDN